MKKTLVLGLNANDVHGWQHRLPRGMHSPMQKVDNMTREEEALLHLRNVLSTTSVRMGSGKNANHLCAACELSGLHPRNGNYRCKCPCHPARAFIARIDAEAAKPVLAVAQEPPVDLGTEQNPNNGHELEI